MLKETNITPDFLKAVTGKFDLETIFCLVMKEKNVYKLNAIVKCKNLVFLNLSKNKISNINGISNLSELTFLDLSYNLINSIEGMENLTKLRHLKLMGNKIEHSKNFTKMKNLINLDKLYFQEANHIESTANPICLISDYRIEMFKIFDNLKSLDGVKKNSDPLSTNLSKDLNEIIDPEDFSFNFKQNIKLDLEQFIIKSDEINLFAKYNEFQKQIEICKQNLK